MKTSPYVLSEHRVLEAAHALRAGSVTVILSNIRKKMTYTTFFEDSFKKIWFFQKLFLPLYQQERRTTNNLNDKPYEENLQNGSSQHDCPEFQEHGEQPL